MRTLSTISTFVFLTVSLAQTTYFWRNDQNPPNNASWQNTSPIYFWNTSGGFAQIPPGGEILAFDGNVGTTMTNNLSATNRYRLEFFATNAASRTINGSTANTFFDFSNSIPAIYNNSGVAHTINFPILIGNTSTGTNPAYGFEINAFNGDFNVGSSISAGNATGQKVLVLMSNDSGNGGSGSIVVSGAITNGSGSLALLKRDNNTATLTNTGNTYTGPTTINAGTLRLNPTGNTTMSTEFRLNGGTLSTSGITSGTSITTSGNFVVQANSTLDLSSDKHTLTFANSSGSAWTSGATLTISGWQGMEGISGTGGQIFVGSNDLGLTATQIAQVSFTGFSNGAMLLPSGELVPAPANLPVQFLGMSTGCEPDGSLILRWATASECYASHFVVERSFDGVRWVALGFVEAHGFSSTRTSYTFTDKHAAQTKEMYYRLIQVDFDGRSETFGPIAQTCSEAVQAWTIFPNPASEHASLHFTWEKAQEGLELVVVDIYGKTVFKSNYHATPGSNLVHLPLENIASGLYYVLIQSTNVVLKQLPLVKQ